MTRRTAATRVRVVLSALVVTFTALTASTAAAQGRWVGTWAAGPLALDPPPADQQAEAAAAPNAATPTRVRQQTVRQIVRTSIGGSRVRVVVTNRFGTEPLEVRAAHVARRQSGSMIATGGPLMFDGEAAITIEAGDTAVSDPVTLDVLSLSDLAIDLYLPGDTWASTSPATIHATGLTTNYVSTAGNHSGALDLEVDHTVQQWLFLSRVDVWTESASGAIVTLGDSITDGTGSTVNANRRWPDFLARRLDVTFGAAAPGVMNVGIGGNRVLSDNEGLGLLRRGGIPVPEPTGPVNPNALFGPSALSRFDFDVLMQPGITHVVVLETTNDIGMAFDDPEPTVDDLIGAHRTLIERAHARALTIYGGTLTPFEGAFYWTDAGEAKRQAVNDWIRTSGAYDAVIDFDAVVRDPEAPTRFRADYHANDWLHPNDAGYQAMANAIDLSLFAPASTEDPQAEAAPTGPRTPWGTPDLTGVWDFRTSTPLERPTSLADKAVLTAEEATAFRTDAPKSRNADRCDGGVSTRCRARVQRLLVGLRRHPDGRPPHLADRRSAERTPPGETRWRR